MKKVVCFLLLFFFSMGLKAQIDYLEPVHALSAYKGELKEYYTHVFELLNTGFQKKAYARFVVIPSFSPEYAMSVEKRNGRCLLVSNTLSRSYWQAERSSVQLQTRTLEISPALYRSLGAIFRLVTSQVQDLDGSGAGLDGVEYYFYATDLHGRELKGRKWTPAIGTLMKQLVQVCQSAYLLTQGKNISETALSQEAAALLKKLQQRTKEAPHAYKRPMYAGVYHVGPYQHTLSGLPVDECAYFADMYVDEYLAQKKIYPATLLKQKVPGYVLCEFTIDKEGNIIRPYVIKSTHSAFSEEALRLVKNMPKWVPAKVAGKPYDSKYTLYIPFRP